MRAVTCKDLVTIIIIKIIQRSGEENVSVTVSVSIVALEWFDGLGSPWVQYLFCDYFKFDVAILLLNRSFATSYISPEIEASRIYLTSVNEIENLRHLKVKSHTILTTLEQESNRVRTKLDISSFPILAELLGSQENALLYTRSKSKM